MITVCFTVDAEPDCPPYLTGWRGMAEGVPALLDMLRDEGVPATFFTTGDAARGFPEHVRRLVAEGHELASHGMTHRAFPTLDPGEAEREVREASELLRAHAPVTAFRAPYLRMPDRYLPLLEADGYLVDSSRGKYKPADWQPSAPTSLVRLPASVTSSWLRLSAPVRDPVLLRLSSPVVLFVHPWELVDLRRAPIPWDCRAGTGPGALERIREVVALFRERGARFLRISEAASAGREEPR